jgi:transcriptional regulator GlxA family with amidase domain
MRRCEELRVPFFNECHAGVTELIIPIILNNVLDGAVFFGPFIDDSSKCVHSFAKNEYVQLKHFDQKLTDAVKTIFSALVLFMLESKEKIIRKQIAEKASNKKIQASLEYINANFKKSISASDAARESCLSVSRFIHLFKEECGVGFSEYLTARRIDEARRMLVETDMKICDISSYCGYAGQAYFGLVFKKATDMSPASYRKKFRRNIEP